MADLPEEILRTIEHHNNTSGKLRSAQEITARYNLVLENYKRLCFMSGDVREQKAAAHAEIKALGWVLGKPDKEVIKDIAANSNKPVFPEQNA